MPLKFNPLTAQFDLTGSGGGGAQYIDGEVATYNDLPLNGTAPLNSAWLVRTASGVWPVSRKQAGIYIRTATAGSSRDADYTYAGTMPDVFSDAVFTLYDDASTTRTGQFNLGSVTAGQNRVLTWPDGNGTIALTTTVVDNATGLWDSANSVTGATVADYELSITDGTNVSNLTFPVGASRNYTLPNAAGTLALTSDFAAPPAIGSTTRNTGAFTTLNANNGTLTASAPVLDLSQTWNNAAVTFTGMRVNATNTASATASLIADFQTGGTSRASIRQDGRITCSQVFTSDSLISGLNVQAATSSFFTWSGADMLIARDAADVLAIRRSANPQTFRIYNTNDSSTAAGTNFERLFLRWNANVAQIGTEAGGTGTARNLELQTGGTTRITLDTVGTVLLQTSGALTFSGRTGITSPAAGAFRLLGTDGSTFNFLYLGVASASYPALKRSSAILQVRLGDDSAYTTIDANHRLQGTAPATSGATGTAGDIRYDADYIYICTAANAWKRAAIATW